MTLDNLDAAGKKQLIEFYKAMKMAAKMFSKGNNSQPVIHIADQIIEELKKEEPDQEKVRSLAEKLQYMSSTV